MHGEKLATIPICMKYTGGFALTYVMCRPKHQEGKKGLHHIRSELCFMALTNGDRHYV